MNEKIKQLAEQARKKPLGDSWCYTSPAEFEQRFAELIVQECTNLVENQGKFLRYSTMASRIRENFGIKNEQ